MPLKFSEVSDQIKTGDILLFQGHGLFSWLIKLRTRSVYSHAGIVQRIKTNGHSRVWVIEALEPFGVRLFPLQRYLLNGDDIDWYQIVDPNVSGEKIADYAIEQVGDHYSFRGLFYGFTTFGRFLRSIAALHKASKLARWSPKNWFCSQLVAKAAANAGFKSDEGKVPIETGPGDLARYSFIRCRGKLVT